jgi:ribose transport system substrate-binding protein
MKLLLRSLLPVVLCALSLSTVRGEEGGTIAFSSLTMNNPFFKEISDSMTAAAAKHGYKVLATSADFDVARQQNQVKDFIVKKVSAIVLCSGPVVSTGEMPVVAEDTSWSIWPAETPGASLFGESQRFQRPLAIRAACG